MPLRNVLSLKPNGKFGEIVIGSHRLCRPHLDDEISKIFFLCLRHLKFSNEEIYSILILIYNQNKTFDVIVLNFKNQ